MWCLSIYLSIDRSIYRSIDLSIYRSIELSNYRSIDLSIYLSIYLSVYLSVCLFVCLSICLSNCKLQNATILRDFLNFWTWKHQKRNNSARLAHVSKLTTSKTKQFCHCETSFENGTLSAELTASYHCVLRFFHFTCLKHCACHEKWGQVIRSAAPVTQNHLPKTEDLMLQNATPLRKSAPGPPSISGKHVSCTAPATENSSWQILFKCPTPAIVFGNATKPSRFARFWQGAQSLAPATRNDIWTNKSGPNMWCF